WMVNPAATISIRRKRSRPRRLLIVPTLLCGNASLDALRPLLNVTRSVTGGIPTQSVGTIMTSEQATKNSCSNPISPHEQLHHFPHMRLGGFTAQGRAAAVEQAKVRCALEQTEKMLGGVERFIDAQGADLIDLRQ